MFVYDKEHTEQLNSIIKKTSHTSYIFKISKHYFKIPFKRSDTQDTLLDILNDTEKFENIIYKEIKDNICDSCGIIDINNRTVNLTKADGASLLESMKFYSFSNINDNCICIFLITNLLDQYLDNTENLKQYAYIFTTFKYDTQVQRNYKNRPYLSLEFTHDILKKLEFFKKELINLGYSAPYSKTVNFIRIGL